MSLKELKEQFVSDLSGGSVLEIYSVGGIALASVFSHTLVTKWLIPNIALLQNEPIPFLVDFYFAVILQLQSLTIYSNNLPRLYIYALSGGVALFVVRILMGRPKKQSCKKMNHEETSGSGNCDMKTLPLSENALLGHVDFITAYRSQMIVITNLAILAVDFHLFPRRFAKVETWGTSLMDLGVGLFVFSMGLANSRSVIKKSIDRNSKKQPYLALVGNNTIKALPVLILGVIRLVSVKSLEYQEHVTEYGVHWNFFMTLGLLPIFVGLLDPILESVPRFLVALGLGVLYEVFLLNFGGSKFILDESNRTTNILTMNKEGIFSFLGYLSIFIFGQSFGSFVLTLRKTPNNLLGMNFGTTPNSMFTVSTTQGLTIMSLISWALFAFARDFVYVGTVSRRLANLAYILMVLSFNALFLLGYSTLEKCLGPLKLSIFDSINKNGLAVFLIANLGTGLINMSLNTLEATAAQAYTILIGYALFWVLVAKFLNHFKFYIRL